SGPVMNLFYWRRLRHQGIHPDLLLVEVLPFLLHEEPVINEIGPSALPTERVSWWELPFLERYDGSDRPHLRQDWLLAVTCPCYTHRLALVSRLLPKLLPWESRVEPAPMANDCGDSPDHDRDFSHERRVQLRHGIERDCTRTMANFRLGARPCAALRELL